MASISNFELKAFPTLSMITPHFAPMRTLSTFENAPQFAASFLGGRQLFETGIWWVLCTRDPGPSYNDILFSLDVMASEALVAGETVP